MTIFTGSGVALVTPYLESTGEIDWPAFEGLIEFHIENETDALIICGTTGEASTQTDEEQILLIKRAVEVSNGRVPIVAGTGINDTRHSIELSQAAEKVGADGLLIVTPYYNKATYAGLIKHFEMIADSVNIPIILYNVPGRTGCNITPEQVAHLAKHENIVALKDAVGDLDYTKQVMELVPEDFAIYSGNDDLTHEMMQMGGKGTISVTANVMPKEVHQMCQYNLEGNSEAAAKINEELDGLNHDLFVEVNPVPVKYLVHRLGRCDLAYRMPLCEPSDEAKKVLDGYLDQISHYIK